MSYACLYGQAKNGQIWVFIFNTMAHVYLDYTHRKNDGTFPKIMIFQILRTYFLWTALTVLDLSQIKFTIETDEALILLIATYSYWLLMVSDDTSCGDCGLWHSRLWTTSWIILFVRHVCPIHCFEKENNVNLTIKFIIKGQKETTRKSQWLIAQLVALYGIFFCSDIKGFSK